MNLGTKETELLKEILSLYEISDLIVGKMDQEEWTKKDLKFFNKGIMKKLGLEEIKYKDIGPLIKETQKKFQDSLNSNEEVCEIPIDFMFKNYSISKRRTEK